MPESRFDPTHAVRFDLENGQIELEGAAERLLVPADALLDVLQVAGEEAQRDFGHRLGADIGRRIAGRIADLQQASLEVVADQLGGELAVIGLGSLAIERWGRALVLRFTGSPLAGGGELALGSVVEGALQRALARDVRAVTLATDDEAVRFLLVSEGTATRIASWLHDGVPWGEALARLHAGAAS